ncbi:hypothetical protein WJX73_009058 [Symbiochloris irregularis]|uniref:Uncharacterized protein n=1 Tax=Symbiochloris irregularis TaxID=706552 RepID=A0AAW1PR00_9CHLO
MAGDVTDVRCGSERGLQDRHDAFGSFSGVARQHVENLRAVLSEALLRHDFRRAAAVAATLLVAAPEGGSTDTAYIPNFYAASKNQQLSEALAAAHEALRRSPDGANLLQLERLLRHAQAWQPSGEHSEAAVLELAWLLATEVQDLSQAYDILAMVPIKPRGPRKHQPVARFARAAFSGLIRYSQWTEVAEEVWAQNRPSRGNRERNAFQHQPLLWTRTHHVAQDRWKDAVRHLQEALRECPHAVDLAWLLAQLLCAANKHPEAMEVAVALCQAAPHEPDAHALKLLLLHAGSPLAEEGTAQQTAQAHVELLRCDPASHQALQGLLDSHKRGPECGQQQQLAEGECIELCTQRAVVAAFVEGSGGALPVVAVRVFEQGGALCDIAAEMVQQGIDLARQLEVQIAAVPSAVHPSGRPRLGPHSPSRGSYLQLPDAWWRCFPQHRRSG